MVDLTVTAAQVGLVNPEKAETFMVCLAETVTAGQPIFFDSNGKAQLADANAAGEQQARGLTLAAGAAGQVISALKRGLVEGFTLTSQSYDDPIFISDTVGVLADAAGTLSVPVGLVVPHTKDASNIEKKLYLDFRWRGDYS